MTREPIAKTPAHDPGRSICEPGPHGYELPPIGPSMGTPDWWRRNVAKEPEWWGRVFSEPFAGAQLITDGCKTDSPNGAVAKDSTYPGLKDGTPMARCSECGRQDGLHWPWCGSNNADHA